MIQQNFREIMEETPKIFSRFLKVQSGENSISFHYLVFSSLFITYKNHDPFHEKLGFYYSHAMEQFSN